MTPRKSLEDLLAEYTEDLLADWRIRLSEDVTVLEEDQRSHLMAMLALVRRLKAVHWEPPKPGEDFLKSLDGRIREEVAQQLAPGLQAVSMPASVPAEAPPAAPRVPLLRRILLGAGWRVVAAGLLVLLLALQVQLYLEIRRLEAQNRDLAARMERLGRVGGAGQPGQLREQQTASEKIAQLPGSPSVDDLVMAFELRLRIEQRVRELEKEAETKRGRDRQVADAVVRELRTLLQARQKP